MKVVLNQEEIIEIVANHLQQELELFRDTDPPRKDTAKLLFHDDILSPQSITFEMNIGDFA